MTTTGARFGPFALATPPVSPLFTSDYGWGTLTFSVLAPEVSGKNPETLNPKPGQTLNSEP
jgi:hypothetical protein